MNFCKRKSKTTVFLLATLASSLCQAITIGEIRRPIEQFLDCSESDGVTQALCVQVQDVVNRELANSNLELGDGGILFNVKSDIDKKIKGGCSTRVYLKSANISGRLRDSASINLSGNSISEPAIFAVSLPIDTNIKLKLKDKYGYRVLGSCNNSGSDSYEARSETTTQADLMITLSLEPKIARGDNGEYIFSIKPIVDVSAAADIQVNKLSFHGKSIVGSLYSTVTGLATLEFKALEAFLRGKSVSKALEQSGMSIGYGTLVTDYLLGNPLMLDKLVTDYLTEISNERVNASALTFERELEEKIERALKLNSDGERFFVFDKYLSEIAFIEEYKKTIKTKNPDYESYQHCTQGHNYYSGYNYNGSNRQCETRLRKVEYTPPPPPPPAPKVRVCLEKVSAGPAGMVCVRYGYR